VHFFFQLGHCGYATGCVGGWLGGHGRWGRYVDDVGGSSADRGDRAAWRAVVDGDVDGGLCSGWFDGNCRRGIGGRRIAIGEVCNGAWRSCRTRQFSRVVTWGVTESLCNVDSGSDKVFAQ
jgi:hypothetical protein